LENSDGSAPVPHAPLNVTTPRVFIAATEQNAGKTTTSLGLYAALRQNFQRIGFIKPIGQRFVEFEGKSVDEDSVLIRETFDTQVPIEDMSPIAVEPKFTRRYINQANNDALVRRVRDAFDRAAWEKDFAIVEGTGHAGVGSVFDLSNARVARLLNCKVILVTPAGIGRPIDEAAVNMALFDRENVEVIGVVMNKVLPDKLESITDIARRGFERLGLELLGVIPRENMLEQSTLELICEHIGGTFLHRGKAGRHRVAHVRIGAMSSENVFRGVRENTLLVVPGDRENVVLTVLHQAAREESPFCGIVLSDDIKPSESLSHAVNESAVAVVSSSLDSYSIASRILSMNVKTLPADVEKIDRIQKLVGTHLNVPRILERIGSSSSGGSPTGSCRPRNIDTGASVAFNPGP
jgi:BioD-like phosphotransacetylase family protein